MSEWNNQPELPGKDQELLNKIDMILAGNTTGDQENDPLYAFCAHLASAVPVANQLFEQKLEAHLITVLEQQSAMTKTALRDTRNNTSRVHLWRLFAGVALGLILVIATTFTLPTWTAIAQTIIKFFTHATNEPIVGEGLIGSDEIEGRDPFQLTISEAESLVEFDIKEPINAPAQALFQGALVMNDSRVMLAYRFRCNRSTPEGPAVARYLIIQQPMAADQVDAEVVGPGASIESVQIREVTGQYVKGAWIPDPHTFGSAGIGTPVSPDEYWNSDVNMQRLVWYEDGILYIIMSAEAGIGLPDCLNSDQLVAIAESLK